MNIRRFVSPSCLVWVAALGFLYFYGSPIFGLFYTKWNVRHEAQLWIVPTPLTNLSVGRSTGKKFSYFGYEFESPWTEVKWERKGENIVVFNFTNGCFISLTNPAESLDQLQVAQQEARKRGRNIRDVFGDKATRSNYALRSTMLHLTPGDLRLFSSRQEMAGNSVLLILKGIWVTKYTDAIYSVQTNWLHGFEIGDMGSRVMGKTMEIQLFDEGDREIDVMVGSGPKTTQPSQEDVNLVVDTLHPVPPSTAADSK